MVGAIVAKDIGVIFEYIGAFGFTCFSFVFPGLFYILLRSKHATGEQLETDGRRVKYAAYMMITLGVLNMILVIVKSSVEASEEPAEDAEADDVEGTPMLGQGLPSFLILNGIIR